MTMTITSPALRRAGALALLAGLLGALWISVARPIVTALDSSDRTIAESRALLARSQRTAAEGPRLRAERDAMVAALEDGSGFLEGDSLALIAARLQDQIKRLVGRHGGTLDSLQTLPPQLQEAFRKVSVRATMTVDTPALQRILHAVETARPVLLVDSLEISGNSLQAGRKARAADRLIVRFDILGFVRGEMS